MAKFKYWVKRLKYLLLPHPLFCSLSETFQVLKRARQEHLLFLQKLGVILGLLGKSLRSCGEFFKAAFKDGRLHFCKAKVTRNTTHSKLHDVFPECNESNFYFKLFILVLVCLKLLIINIDIITVYHYDIILYHHYQISFCHRPSLIYTIVFASGLSKDMQHFWCLYSFQ